MKKYKTHNYIQSSCFEHSIASCPRLLIFFELHEDLTICEILDHIKEAKEKCICKPSYHYVESSVLCIRDLCRLAQCSKNLRSYAYPLIQKIYYISIVNSKSH